MDTSAFLNTATFPVARAFLTGCCPSSWWIWRLLDGRPYRDLRALRAAASAAFDELSWRDVVTAAASAARAAGDRVDPDLHAASTRYERRFGHVFLAADETTDPLPAIRRRLRNDVAAESSVLRDELRRIMLRRLERPVVRGRARAAVTQPSALARS